jgi:hypothetical protein
MQLIRISDPHLRIPSAQDSDWEQFLQDVVEDGLLVRVGTALTFSHLSFQEFLAARDSRDHMGNRPRQALSWYFNGRDCWREVLAFYVTLSDRPGETDEWLIKRAIASSTTVAAVRPAPVVLGQKTCR